MVCLLMNNVLSYLISHLRTFDELIDLIEGLRQQSESNAKLMENERDTMKVVLCQNIHE